MRQGRGVRAGGDEPCDMGHVDQQLCFDGFGDACHAFEVDRARIGGAAGDQQHRAHLAGPGLDPVVVEQAARAVHTVVMGVEPAPRKVRPGAVAEMTARREVEAQDPVSRLQQHEEHRLVRLRARMRLHVGVGGAEEFPSRARWRGARRRRRIRRPRGSGFRDNPPVSCCRSRVRAPRAPRGS